MKGEKSDSRKPEEINPGKRNGKCHRGVEDRKERDGSKGGRQASIFV